MSTRNQVPPSDVASHDSLLEAIEERLQQEKGKAAPGEEEEYAPPHFPAYDDSAPVPWWRTDAFAIIMLVYAVCWVLPYLSRLWP